MLVEEDEQQQWGNRNKHDVGKEEVVIACVLAAEVVERLLHGDVARAGQEVHGVDEIVKDVDGGKDNDRCGNRPQQWHGAH